MTWESSYRMEITPPLEGVPVTKQNLLFHHDSHPVALLMYLDGLFGEQWREWDGETIFTELFRKCAGAANGYSIPEVNMQKIQGIRALVMSDVFCTDWPSCEKITLALNNVIPDFANFQKPTLAQYANAFSIFRRMRPNKIFDYDTKSWETLDVPANGNVFDDEIKMLVAGEAYDEGLDYLPYPLDFAQEVLNPMMYRCTSCGNVDSLTCSKENQVCEVCAGIYRGAQPLSPVPTEWGKGNLEMGVGTKLEFFQKNPFQEVKDGYEKFKDTPISEVDLGEHPNEIRAAVQVAKLFIIRDYIKMRNGQLVEQLTMLEAPDA